jgi:enoyl-CoA hydratase
MNRGSLLGMSPTTPAGERPAAWRDDATSGADSPYAHAGPYNAEPPAYRTMTYDVTGRVARITFNRPERGNAITADTPVELADAVERADLDPVVQAANHDPAGTWDPMVDYAMMSRFNRGFASLLFANKPTVVKVHGFCVAGGTDIALYAGPSTFKG